MRAAVTENVGQMSVLDRPEPGEPGPGQVLVHPEAVGICGSDYHFFSGHLSAAAGGSQFPRILGHEVGAAIAAIGPGCRPELQTGQRVAMLPISNCGRCYPCSVGRPNACDNFSLVGIHTDGGLQELLCLPQDQVFPIQAADGALAALAEPVSVAVHAVHRGRIQPGERVVVFGAGPIGQCVAVVARELGAEALLVDPQESRLELGRALGAETLRWTSADEVVGFGREWGGVDGSGGPPVVVDATGVPSAVRAMVEIVASAGRAVQVGMSTDDVSIRIGALTEKELDVLGASCCTSDDFGEAVGVVERNAGALAGLISHEFDLGQAPEAMRFAMSNPTEVMKVVIRGE
ncbi:MAG TPA: alcohol dehydrogenase catalytic domain-containing protein [Solirubrobacteraceae bacterium]|jgi:L-gulonate 5-dehydrogenase|nr:alcohol dehydrogenase catalytic domain-containing protein [Solirubrobacteraceae bacterium]